MARKPGRKSRETREAWEAGRVDGWSYGERGVRVRVTVHKRGIRISHQDPVTREPTPKQLFPRDTPANRRKAAETAVLVSEALRKRAEEHASRDEAVSGATLTLPGCLLLYMQRFPGFAPEMFAWKCKRLREWHTALPEQVRASEVVPSAETLVADLSAWRRLLPMPVFDRPLADIDLAEINRAYQDLLGSGYSPRTATNTMARASAAVNWVQRHHRRRVGALINPFLGAAMDRSTAQVPEYTPAEVRKLRAAAAECIRQGRFWQLFAFVGIASSGRRIGSVLALTPEDHDWTPRWGETGELLPWRVTWRADVSKGGGYQRGDEVRPMTRAHADAVLWCYQTRPNPIREGRPSLPLLWSGDGSEAITQDSLAYQLRRVEELAGVASIRGRLFHSFRRAVATLVADDLGLAVAAEFVGMTPETLAKHYKRVVEATQQKAAASVDAAFTEEGK